MTLEEFYQRGRLNLKLSSFRNKLRKAKEEIERVLTQYEKPYLACSGGKDSMAMMYLVHDVAKKMNKSFVVWSHLSNASFPGTYETIKKGVETLGLEWVVDSNQDAYKYLKRGQMAKFGKGGVFYSKIREFAKDYDLAFVGTRAYESLRRMRSIKIKGMTFYSKSMGDVTVCCPLAWMTLNDVASLVVMYDVPMHPIYSKHDFEGTYNENGEPHWIRLGYTTARDLRDRGFAQFLKLNYPDIYNEIKEIDESITFF